MPDTRKLSDADVEALAEALKKKVVTEFYQDLGKGVWAMAWRVIVIGLVLVASYGAAKHL